ncbi:MAG: hypothetical protein ABSC42_13430 [Tepidisphaeraceae bacterium]
MSPPRGSASPNITYDPRTGAQLSGPLSFTLYTYAEVAPGAFVGSAYTVNIPNLPQIAVPGETPTSAANRKANTIAAAINSLGDPNVMATVVQAAPPNTNPMLTVSNCFRITSNFDPTRQPAGAGRLVPGRAPSPGNAMGAMYSPGGIDSVATGLDPTGAPSLVQLGIDGDYVSQISPTSGETSLSVLEQLDTDLTDHGIPMDLDVPDESLSFADPILPGETMDWGDSDAGLDLTYDFGMSSVPEPMTFSMAGVFGAALLAGRRARPRKTGQL